MNSTDLEKPASEIFHGKPTKGKKKLHFPHSINTYHARLWYLTPQNFGKLQRHLRVQHNLRLMLSWDPHFSRGRQKKTTDTQPRHQSVAIVWWLFGAIRRAKPLTIRTPSRTLPQCLYRVAHLVWDLGWQRFGWSTMLPAAQPILPNSQLPKQNHADSGMTKMEVNPDPGPRPRPPGSPCIPVLLFWGNSHCTPPEIPTRTRLPFLGLRPWVVPH